MDRCTIITGGAGFIGSHLAHRLHAQGRRLILIDNLATGRRENIARLLGDRCTLIESRASEALDDPALTDHAEEIYHLAAAVGVKLVVSDPAAMVHNNIAETSAVLRAAERANHGRGAAVLLASSSEVYGKCPVLPLREDMDLVYGPTTASRWSYGLTKAIDEHLAIQAARRDGLRAVIVRLFNTIGPRQLGRYGMVVPRFVQAAVRQQPLQVYNDGAQTRTFCDARDVTHAMADLLAAPGAYGGVFNVGSQTQVTIYDLAQRVNELADNPAGIELVPYEAVYGEGFEDPPHRLPDTSKLREVIGFEPTYALDDTLGELIAHERQRVGTAAAQQPESGAGGTGKSSGGGEA